MDMCSVRHCGFIYESKVIQSLPSPFSFMRRDNSGMIDSREELQVKCVPP